MDLITDVDKHNSGRDSMSYPPIDPEWSLFYQPFGWREPVHIHGYQWSTTFGRWSALVTFHDGWHGFTFPKTW